MRKCEEEDNCAVMMRERSKKPVVDLFIRHFSRWCVSNFKF